MNLKIAILHEYTMIEIRQFIPESGCMRVLGVHDEYRLRGIARSLLNRVFELAMEKECTSVGLSTIKETGNVQIFERIGFEIVGEHEEIYCEGPNGERVSDIEMEFRLTRQSSGRGGIRPFMRPFP